MSNIRDKILTQADYQHVLKLLEQDYVLSHYVKTLEQMVDEIENIIGSSIDRIKKLEDIYR